MILKSGMLLIHRASGTKGILIDCLMEHPTVSVDYDKAIDLLPHTWGWLYAEPNTLIEITCKDVWDDRNKWCITCMEEGLDELEQIKP